MTSSGPFLGQYSRYLAAFPAVGRKAGIHRARCSPPALSPLWGIYSGFELFENAALGRGREVLDSEKFQYRPVTEAAEESGENLNMLLGRLNPSARSTLHFSSSGICISTTPLMPARSSTPRGAATT